MPRARTTRRRFTTRTIDDWRQRAEAERDRLLREVAERDCDQSGQYAEGVGRGQCRARRAR
jgi:hypothetical protein